jgi:hypothetical protein
MNSNVLGEERREGPADLFRRARGIDDEIARLSRGVDTGVGPTGAVDGYGLAENVFDSAFENTLDRPKPRLFLPAVKIGAVVFGEELEVSHGFFVGIAIVRRRPLSCAVLCTLRKRAAPLLAPLPSL